MDEFTLGHRLRRAPPVEQLARIVPALVLEVIAPLGGEGALAVLLPSAREIGSHRVAATHCDLRAVVDLRNAAGGEQECEPLLELPCRITRIHEAADVVVIEKRQHMVRVRYEEILSDHLIDLEETRLRALACVALVKYFALSGESQVEIHHRLELRIAAVHLRPALPPSGGRVAWIPPLTHDIEVGVLILDLLTPSHHEIIVGIGVCVHAYAVDARVFYPPYTVLYKILGKMAVTLVQVGHTGHKPSVGQYILFGLRRMRVEKHPLVVSGVDEAARLLLHAAHDRVPLHLSEGVELLHRCRKRRATSAAPAAGCRVAARCRLTLAYAAGIVDLIEPVIVRNILNPPVAAPRVVEDHVHDHLDIFVMSGLNHVAILLVASQSRVDHVEIRYRIAVRRIPLVELHRIEPYSRHA